MALAVAQEPQLVVILPGMYLPNKFETCQKPNRPATDNNKRLMRTKHKELVEVAETYHCGNIKSSSFVQGLPLDVRPETDPIARYSHRIFSFAASHVQCFFQKIGCVQFA